VYLLHIVCYSINFVSYEDLENSEGDLDDPELGDEGDNADGIIFRLVVQPKYRSRNKN
jgi:hypothetical protein